MNRGKTFSITVPHKMVDEYDRLAKELHISRSKVVFNILLNNWNLEYPDKPLIECGHAEGLYCLKYQTKCEITDAKECIIYTPRIKKT
jgi:metal-responsive CopG/Arc/MetJ family transcriptional regulator